MEPRSTLLPLREQAEEIAEGFNPDWLLRPTERELIKPLDECLQRLQAWAFYPWFYHRHYHFRY
jgi:hypothetical protein